ncbi:hypothetical protein CSB45_04425 [candidate division KSB3 bacterium]|uniref:General secretion pathway GspH domain-containing protein n=1 Tax=candidate division KSB3 bacterium TaxID=2044937 RepID=A0A2G6E960_9BACT|nr:MAG: hypothetical protein CSB45_04425 [candidate division KSB3 bacterium]PIE30623.1 MAG: hypothetical protein CSA57_03010 [candidate division KSB3 bacterium]
MALLSKKTRGMTLIELLIVIAIIGILVMIATPNFYNIMRKHRLRSSANDLLSKARWVRTVAIAKRRQLEMTIHDGSNPSLTVKKPKHTEYNLLKDIAGALLQTHLADPLKNFVLFEEAANTLGSFTIGDKDKPGYSSMTTNCPAKTISFSPSGTLSATCNISIISDTGASYTLELYKGGQMILR